MERRLVELRETTKIVRGAAAGFSSGLVFNLMSFGFYLAIVRLLPTDSLGVFYTLQLVMGFITTFGLLSLPSGVNRFVTGFVQTNRLEEARYLFRKGLTMAFFDFDNFTTRPRATFFVSFLLVSRYYKVQPSF